MKRECNSSRFLLYRTNCFYLSRPKNSAQALGYTSIKVSNLSLGSAHISYILYCDPVYYEFRLYNFKHGWQFFRKSCRARDGAAIRSYIGQWIKGFSLNLGITTNNVAELEAVRYGLMSAWNLGFKFVILNLYSTLFIQWLSKKGPYAPYFVPLIDDCRNLIG